MANEVEVCDMSKKLIMGVVMALALVVCIYHRISMTCTTISLWIFTAQTKVF